MCYGSVQVQTLALMSDAERLELLKEVAGTRVYDEKRSQTLRMIHEAGGKKMTIDDALHMLQERMSELDQEKEEYERFQVVSTVKVDCSIILLQIYALF